MAVAATKFVKIEALNAMNVDSVIILGASVCGYNLAKKLKKFNKQVTIVHSDFKFEGSDHNYHALQSFVRKANTDAYDRELSQYYGWKGVPNYANWQDLLLLYNNGLNEIKSELMASFSGGLKPIDSEDSTMRYNYSFDTQVVKDNFEFGDELTSLLSSKTKIEAFELEKLPNDSKPVLIYASAPEAIEYALFLSQYTNIECVVIIPKQLESHISQAILPYLEEYLATRKVHCVPEEKINDKAYLNDEKISKLIEQVETAIFYPKFSNKLSLNTDSIGKELFDSIKLCNSFDFDQQIVLASKLAQSICSSQPSQMVPNNSLYHIFAVRTPHEFCSVGMTEDQMSKMDQSKLKKYSHKANILEHETSWGAMPPSIIVMTEDIEKKKIISLQILSPSARKMMSGMMLMSEYNLKFDDLGTNIGIHPTFAENLFSNLKEGLDLDAAAGCST